MQIRPTVGSLVPAQRLGALVLASLLASGCSRTDAPKSERKMPEPGAVVAKALGKGHVPKESPWASRAACEAELEKVRSGPARKSSPRLATWNVRYFPDGAEHGPEGQATDLDWLACAIALLDVDVLAVQEFKTNARGQQAATELIAKLSQRTGRRYRLELARCEPRDVQHPGLLYDEDRVAARALRDLPELNPDGKCTNSASPGFASYLSFKGGPDFHLIVVHAYAGNTRREHAKRGLFLDALQSAVAKLSRVVPDADVVVTGDFNTSGCTDCSPVTDSAAEVRALAQRVAAFPVPMRSLPSSEGCSFVADQQPVLLDHFLVSEGFQELPADARAVVSGVCRASDCVDVLPKAKAEKVLSDHCPLLLELENEDLD